MKRHIFPTLLAALIACQGSPQDTLEPEEVVPEATPEPTPSDVLLYGFLLELEDGARRGTRVYDDGRLEVLHTDDGNGDWVVSRTIPPAAVQALKGALNDESTTSLPDRLPVSLNAPEDSPTATWTFQQGNGLKTVTAPRYAGVRVPAIERLNIILRRAQADQQLSTTWSIHEKDEVITATVPCQPLTTTTLRVLAARILNPDNPVEDDTGTDAPRLVIDWSEKGTTWRTTVTQDHRIVRTRPDGTRRAQRADNEAWDAIEAAIQKVDWSEAHRACD